MFTIRFANIDDIAVWRRFDAHIAESELRLKIGNHRCYLLQADSKPVGILRYNLFWDSIPFVTLLYLAETERGKGYGRTAMARWEADMRGLGYPCVMTSTQADEGAQHFYRKLRYKDTGCLLLDVPPYAQPAELFLIKAL